MRRRRHRTKSPRPKSRCSPAVTSRDSRRDVTGASPAEKLPDRDDISVSTSPHADTVPAGTEAGRPIDNSGDASLVTPTSGREDNGDVRVRFRFDSVSCRGADQKDATSTCPLPKEPHPVRDQAVHRRCMTRDDSTDQSLGDIRLRLSSASSPALQRTLSESTEDDGGSELASPRPRWLFRGRSGQRQKPSSALRKEIKAARQLGVIMGAFTVCFLPYFVDARGPP